MLGIFEPFTNIQFSKNSIYAFETPKNKFTSNSDMEIKLFRKFKISRAFQEKQFGIRRSNLRYLSLVQISTTPKIHLVLLTHFKRDL